MRTSVLFLALLVAGLSCSSKKHNDAMVVVVRAIEETKPDNPASWDSAEKDARDALRIAGDGDQQVSEDVAWVLKRVKDRRGELAVQQMNAKPAPPSPSTDPTCRKWSTFCTGIDGVNVFDSFADCSTIDQKMDTTCEACRCWSH